MSYIVEFRTLLKKKNLNLAGVESVLHFPYPVTHPSTDSAQCCLTFLIKKMKLSNSATYTGHSCIYKNSYLNDPMIVIGTKEN